MQHFRYTVRDRAARALGSPRASIEPARLPSSAQRVPQQRRPGWCWWLRWCCSWFFSAPSAHHIHHCGARRKAACDRMVGGKSDYDCAVLRPFDEMLCVPLGMERRAPCLPSARSRCAVSPSIYAYRKRLRGVPCLCDLRTQAAATRAHRSAIWTASQRAPARDEGYEAWIRTLPCCGCAVEGRSEAAHTGTDGGMSMKASDYSCVPLCADCHTRAPGAYHRIGKRAFETARGLRFSALVAQLRREWQGQCA